MWCSINVCCNVNVEYDMIGDYLCDQCKHVATCECAYDEYNRVINDDWTDDCLGVK